MRYATLGRTGVVVSRLAFGTWTFGESRFGHAGVGEPEARALVAQALDAGVNLFDTSNNYSDGEAEVLLGRALGERRGEVLLATKVRSPVGPGVNDQGLSRRHILAAVEGSLRRLGTEWIDIYFVHGWDVLTAPEETARALDQLVRDGKVRYLGASNLAAWQLGRFLAIAAAEGLARFEVLQVYYNPLGRDIEHEVVPLATDQGLAVTTWSPLAGGLLTGKYRRGGSGRRTLPMFREFPPLDASKVDPLLDALEAIAAAHGTTPAAAAIAWQLGRPWVTAPILGARTPRQLADTLAAADLELTAEELARIDALTVPAPYYPNWMIAFQNAGRRPGA